MSTANAAVPADAIAEADVEYVRHGERGLLARVYRPAGEGPFPAVVEVHGGMWISNDRLRDAALARELARRGTLVMSIDFRMPPGAAYPASIQDIHAAIVWLKAHAAELRVDPARIGALGLSSGGHQVLLLGLVPGNAHYASGAGDASVAFVAACFPIVDPVQRYGMAREKGRSDLVNGHDLYWGGVEAMAEGNPQYILDQNRQTHTPQALIVQGTADDNIDHRTIDPFADAYRRRGGVIEVHKLEGAPHAFIRDDLTTPHAARAVDLIDDLIRRQAPSA